MFSSKKMINYGHAAALCLLLKGPLFLPLYAESAVVQAAGGPTTLKAAGPVRRLSDGKPDLSGYYTSDDGGANSTVERYEGGFRTPPTRGIIIDPKDGKLPYQPWARAEQIQRSLPQRGYDDPAAHCFAAGVPRTMYVPVPYQILQPPGYVVILSERMAWRIIPVDGRSHIPDSIRLWQGDSVGHWEGDTLIVDNTNFNGKTWLNQFGDVVSYALHVVERFTPVDANTIKYQATITDPLVYTRPWTIEFPLNRENDELLEVACHEDNEDLEHLKDVRDEYRAQVNKKR
jgi:hypothetical protein